MIWFLSCGAVPSTHAGQAASMQPADCMQWQNLAPTLQLQATQNNGHWAEYTSTHQRLLHENGALTGLQINAQWRCNGWTLLVGGEQQQGTRRYEGQTNLGVPLRTTSSWVERNGRLQLEQQWSDNWSGHVGLQSQTWHRTIQSTSTALGYPERYRLNWLQAGLTRQQHEPWGHIDWRVQLGQAINPTMRLSLPNRDDTQLRLGKSHQIEVGIDAYMPLQPNLQIGLHMAYQRTLLRRSTTNVITQQGVPSGLATQPQSEMTQWPVGLSMAKQF